MVSRFVTIVIVVPLAIVLIALAVANRAPAQLTIDPFNPGNPALSVTMPLFVMLFAAAALGLVVGSFATWWKQGYYRKLARQRQHDLRPPASAAPQAQPQQSRPAIAGPNG